MYAYVAMVVVAMGLGWWLNVLVLVQEVLATSTEPRPLAKKVVYMSIYAFMMAYLRTGST